MFFISFIFSLNLFVGAHTQRPVKSIPYTRRELITQEVRDTYRGEYIKQVAFPLGGIGTGCISLSGRGALIDWEIFNRANKGFRPRFTFLSLWTKKAQESKSIFRVLEGEIQPPYEGQLYRPPAAPLRGPGFGWGPSYLDASGLLRMKEFEFIGRFPFAKVKLSDEEVPLSVIVEGWSPFIPGDAKNSSIPVAIINVLLKNQSEKEVEAVLGVNIQNICGWPELGGAVNRIIKEPGFNALTMSTVKHSPDSPRFGTMVLSTTEKINSWQHYSAGTGNFTGDFMAMNHFIETFGKTGKYDCDKFSYPIDDPNSMIGSLGIPLILKPEEEKKIQVIIAWHFPNFEHYWRGFQKVSDGGTWKNYYATQWEDAMDVTRYVLKNIKKLESETRLFQETFFSSTLPGTVLESISSVLTTLRSTSVLRLPDGTLYGFEGTHGIYSRGGSCYGSCSHVWNYEQSMAYLFPSLERSMREIDYEYNLRESDGHMSYRLRLPPGTYSEYNSTAAADGQLGGVLRVYREWQISGNDNWLKKIWPKVKKALEYAWVKWDINKDGFLTEPHAHTLDYEFHGPETMCGSIYQAALLAAKEIANYLGEEESAKEYNTIFESGRKKSDEILFNGEYYYQRITNPEAPYQFGNGCISEQLIGQWYASMLDLGHVYNKENIHTALASLFKYNYISDGIRKINNPFREYCLNDERGLLICTWPKGGRPEKPLLYSNETWSGAEYQVAGNLFYEGYILEGLTIIKSLRYRYDGKKRNPYNEFECGNHYVRSMANYSALLALSGWHYSGVDKMMSIDPQVYADDFKVFFCVDGGWGTISQKKGGLFSGYNLKSSIDVAKGKVKISKLILNPGRRVKDVTATLGTKGIEPTVKEIDNGKVEVYLSEIVEITHENPLIVKLR